MLTTDDTLKKHRQQPIGFLLLWETTYTVTSVNVHCLAQMKLLMWR